MYVVTILVQTVIVVHGAIALDRSMHMLVCVFIERASFLLGDTMPLTTATLSAARERFHACSLTPTLTLSFFPLSFPYTARMNATSGLSPTVAFVILLLVKC